MEKALIVAKNLTRIYSVGSKEVTGVQGVDLEIGEGNFVVLKGESGSGKSTLLSLLAGLDKPTAGQLTVAGQDLRHASPRQLNHFRRRVTGVIFQSFNLLPTLTVQENICLPALLAGRPYEQVKKEANGYLDWLNLGARASHYPGQLSGGEMQRAAIVRAIINHPALILADEPTGNLDSRNGQIVIDLLEELHLQRNRTIIIATHSKLADACASMEVCLKDGMISATAAK